MKLSIYAETVVRIGIFWVKWVEPSCFAGSSYNVPEEGLIPEIEFVLAR